LTKDGKRYQTETVHNDSVTRSFAYDAEGHVTDEWLGKTSVRHVEYNADGTIAAETVDGVRVAWSYAGTGYPSKPSRKTWPDGSSVSYTYNLLGQTETEIDALGGVTRLLYTASGRDSLKVGPAGDSVLTEWKGGLKIAETLSGKGATPRTRIWRYNELGLDTAEYVAQDGDTALALRKGYDGEGRLRTEGDAMNAKVKSYARNAAGHETGDTVWSAAGKALVTRRILDADMRVVGEVLANGDSAGYWLDGQGNRTKELRYVKAGTTQTLVSAHKTRHDWRGLPVAEGDSVAGAWRMSYASYTMRGDPARRIGPRNDTTLWVYSPAGLLAWERDAAGMWTHHAYDELGREVATTVLAKTSVADTSITSYAPTAEDRVSTRTLDALGRVVSQSVNGSVMRRTGYFADGRVRADSVAVDATEGKWLVTQYAWSPTGELKSTARTGNVYNEYVYNMRGQKIAELARNASGSLDTTRTYSYDLAGRLVEERTPGMGGVRYTYNMANRRIASTDSSGVYHKYGLDALGRVVADTNGLGYVAKRAYGANVDTSWDRNNFKTVVIRDMLGRTTSIKDNEGTQTTFIYELKPDGTQRDSIAYPDGAWEVTVTDKNGRTLQKVDSRNILVNYTYNNQWQIESINYGGGLTTNYEYDSQGRAKAVVRIDGAHTTKSEWTFDNAGRPLASTQTTDGVPSALGYSYDDVNRQVTLTLPDGKTIVKRMDVRGRIDSVAYNGTTDALYKYSLNALDTATLGNGVGVKWTNAESGRAKSEAYSYNGTSLHSYSVGYNVAGLAKDITRGTEVEKMSYDKEGQLTGWRHGSDTTGWTLDSRGSWTNLWKNGNNIESRTFNGGNEIASRTVSGVAQAVAQDGIGQLTQLGTETFAWSADKKLEVINGSTILYDGLGRMVRRIDGASVTDYLYDDWSVIREVRNDLLGSSIIDYTYGPRYVDEVLAMHVNDGNGSRAYWYLRDQNMDVAGVMDASGSVVEKYSVGPYGDVKIADAQGSALVASGVGNTRFFQGLEKVGEIYSVRNRMFSPELGRFLSRDPIGYFGGEQNFYLSYHGNPVSYVDPYGLAWSTIDFVRHFFTGSGSPVNLATVGLLDQFKGTQGISQLYSEIRLAVYHNQLSGEKTSISPSKQIAWSLGNVRVIGKYQCDKCQCFKTNCTILFSIDEWFSDPYNQWEDEGYKYKPDKIHDRDAEFNKYGEPYPITATWADRKRFPCGARL
jgi:RHS repeat-associated protein